MGYKRIMEHKKMSESKHTKGEVADVNAVLTADVVTHRKINLDNSKDKNEHATKFILYKRDAAERKDINFL